MFILVHLFGHTVQWNVSRASARDRRSRKPTRRGPRTQLAEVADYEREACRYSLQLLHDAGVHDLDQWISDFAACDTRLPDALLPDRREACRSARSGRTARPWWRRWRSPSFTPRGGSVGTTAPSSSSYATIRGGVLARRIIAVSPDKAFGKQLAIALKAAGGAVDVAYRRSTSSAPASSRPRCVVVHLDGDARRRRRPSCSPRLTGDTRVIAILPRSNLAAVVDIMQASRSRRRHDGRRGLRHADSCRRWRPACSPATSSASRR